MIAVADERDVHAAEPAFEVGGRVPRLERVLGVGAGEDDGAGARVEELVEAGGEGFDFRRADEGEGFREEDQDEPVVGFGVGREVDFCEGLSVSVGECGLVECGVPFNRPSTTPVQLKAGAGRPTWT